MFNYYLYDRIIDIDLVKKNGRKISIKCKSEGIKPDISFSIVLLPKEKCFQAAVSIRNLNLPDIRDYVKMGIKAGYRGVSLTEPGSTISFDMPIFSSYHETPNPDGITTFNGLVVGDITGFISDNPVDIKVNSSVPLDELITEVVKVASHGQLKPYNWLDKSLKYTPPAGGFTNQFDTGYGALMWLQTVVFEYGKYILHSPTFLTIWNNKVNVFTLDKNKMDEKLLGKYNIVNLNAVTNASFTGPALSVVAPWDPRVIPGSIIKMKPSYYKGLYLPNILPESDFSPISNLYYVLREEVKFSTIGSTNQMNLFAVPVDKVIKDDNNLVYKEEEIPEGKMVDLMKTYIEQHSDVRLLVELGKTEGNKSATVPSGMTDFWSAADDTFQSFGHHDDVLSGGDGWSNKAFLWYGGTWHVSRDKLIQKYGKDTYLKICKDSNVPDITVTKKTINIQMTYFWPLIPLATYWKYKVDGYKGPYGVWPTDTPGKGVTDELKIDFGNPDNVRGAIKIWVPSITVDTADTGQLDKFAEAFISFGKYYIDTYKNYASATEDVVNKRARYEFGIQTYLAGVCLGGYDG